MASSKYVILQQNPTLQEYHDLRKAAGLTPPPLEAIPKALAGSWVSFVAFERGLMESDTNPTESQPVIAMGRLIGDGALFLQVVNIAVHPTHQHKGLGKQIIQKLVEYTDEYAPHAYVSLVADPLGQRLYPQYGFEDVAPGAGMFRCLRIQRNREAEKLRRGKAAALPESGRLLQKRSMMRSMKYANNRYGGVSLMEEMAGISLWL